MLCFAVGILVSLTCNLSLSAEKGTVGYDLAVLHVADAPAQGKAPSLLLVTGKTMTVPC